jgi:hypothetical protein
VETFLEQQVGPNHQKLKSTVEVLSAKVDELEKKMHVRVQKHLGEEKDNLKMAMCQIACLMGDLAEIRRNQNHAVGLYGPHMTVFKERTKEEPSPSIGIAGKQENDNLLNSAFHEMENLDKKFTITCNSHASDLEALKAQMDSLQTNANQNRESGLEVGLSQGLMIERLQSRLDIQQDALNCHRHFIKGLIKDAKESMWGALQSQKGEILEVVKAMISKDRAERTAIEELISASMEPLGDKLSEAILEGTSIIRVEQALKQQEHDNIIGNLKSEVLRLKAMIQAYGLVAATQDPVPQIVQWPLPWQKSNNVTKRPRQQLPSEPSRLMPKAASRPEPMAASRPELMAASRPEPSRLAAVAAAAAAASVAATATLGAVKRKLQPSQPSKPEPVAEASAAPAKPQKNRFKQLPSQPSRFAEAGASSAHILQPPKRKHDSVEEPVEEPADARPPKKRQSAVMDAISAKRHACSVPGSSLGDAGYILCDAFESHDHGNAGGRMQKAERHGRQRGRPCRQRRNQQQVQRLRRIRRNENRPQRYGDKESCNSSGGCTRGSSSAGSGNRTGCCRCNIAATNKLNASRQGVHSSLQ